MKIGIHANEFDDRGCGNVAYNYGLALKNRGYEVCFVTTADAPNKGMNRLRSIGNVFCYEGQNGQCEPTLIKRQIETLVESEKIDFLHMLKFGTDDGITPTNCKTGIHCIFDMSQPHGDYYVGVSEYLANKFSSKNFVPHIISPMAMTEAIRQGHGIPADALVLGRHGGFQQFDVDWVKSAMLEALEWREDLYFLLLNTEKFSDHERIIHLPWVEAQQDVWNFIHACDAMIHARTMGETFGLSCAEFSAANKPVLTWDGSGGLANYDRAHLSHLGDAALEYSNFGSLVSILKTMDANALKLRNWDRTSIPFSEVHVMAQYEKEFHLKTGPNIVDPASLEEKPMDFESVFNRHGTDKGSYWHNYGKAYEYLLGHMRSEKFKMLEIGVYEGKSILSWMDIFPEATIIGIDNNTAFKNPCERVHIISGDQSNADFLKLVGVECGPFSVIIDDGSHLPEDQQKSLGVLWSHLAPGGVYVIEDLEVSYVADHQSDGCIPTLDWLKSMATVSALKTGGKDPWVFFLGEMAALVKR